MGKKVNKLFQKTKKTFFPTGKQVATLQKLRPTADNYETVASFDLVSCQLIRFRHFWPSRAFCVNWHLEHLFVNGLIFIGFNSILLMLFLSEPIILHLPFIKPLGFPKL